LRYLLIFIATAVFAECARSTRAIIIDSVAVNISKGEKQALTDMFNLCGGSSWINSTNWMNGDPCNNKWFGVVCASSHVVELVLPGNNLVCKSGLLSTIVNLFQLQKLELSNNSINGQIPDNLNQIRTLEWLGLSYDSLSGVIPTDLGDLVDFSLLYVNLAENQLSGVIPDFLDNPALKYVNISGNNFSCHVPTSAVQFGGSRTKATTNIIVYQTAIIPSPLACVTINSTDCPPHSTGTLTSASWHQGFYCGYSCFSNVPIPYTGGMGLIPFILFRNYTYWDPNNVQQYLTDITKNYQEIFGVGLFFYFPSPQVLPYLMSTCYVMTAGSASFGVFPGHTCDIPQFFWSFGLIGNNCPGGTIRVDFIAESCYYGEGFYCMLPLPCTA